MNGTNTNGPAVHEWTGPQGYKFRDVREPSGTYYRDTTPRAVVDALERARVNGRRVRLFLGDSKTGLDWGEENDVCGKIGRSTGEICIPLMIANSRSMGGDAILCDCIVRLLVDGREVYRHPTYSAPEYTVSEIQPGAMVGTVDLRAQGYTHTVSGSGANFKSQSKAERYAAFMRGDRAGK